MDIDFIRWMVDKSEGFELITSFNWVFCEDKMPRDEKEFDSVYFPFLLQRAIEGVNNDIHKWFIRMDCSEINIYKYGGYCNNYFSIEAYESIDRAKESALRYIYEQEKSNGST